VSADDRYEPHRHGLRHQCSSTSPKVCEHPHGEDTKASDDLVGCCEAACREGKRFRYRVLFNLPLASSPLVPGLHGSQQAGHLLLVRRAHPDHRFA
jgi:hypothetical protein